MGDVLIGREADTGRPVHLVATAGVGVGRGHIARALTLAEVMRGRGLPVSLELTAGDLDGGLLVAASRLGVERRTRPPGGAVVVVDLPDVAAAIDRAPTDRLVVFDDRNAFAGRAAVVVQPSLPSWAGAGSADRVLAGYAYAPVAMRYRALRTSVGSERDTAVRRLPRVVVCFGGSDPSWVTRRVSTALTGALWRTSIVVGSDFSGRIDDLPSEVLRDPPDLPERIAACDLAVIGAGTMKFEVACLRRPALLLAVADDQLPVGPAFATSGSARWLGDGRTIDPDEVHRAVATMLADPDALASMGARAGEVVDGLGADRLVDAIASLAR